MAELGYTLSTEEFAAPALVSNARRAEEAGFTFALISDHFHPWVERQGQSPFAWTVLGGVAEATERLRIGTGVTCPTIRYHPAIVAQAAATVADLMPGRFFLGLGTGENLNEHVVGQGWPEPAVRREMLDEAVHIIRTLWQGDTVSYRGSYFTVERARIYSLPEKLPDIYIAASGPRTAKLAGAVADGFIGVAPDASLIKAFREAGGAGKSCIGQVNVCWAETEEQARRTAIEWWPNAAVSGETSLILQSPSDFDALAKLTRDEEKVKGFALGPDPEVHLATLRAYVEAGYTHVYVHQVGPDQEGFFRFYERNILPEFQRQLVRAEPA
ncbi:MAG TPA: TIGR03557 family F420-dependent LLM class oxidoreductase [Dehalococcoidia bacterium]|nr:TIGR03557 family F420-dependent LLM class oxidoreductase [Dehalococcoidia bacterium]